MELNPAVAEVTERIRGRSRASRADYLDSVAAARSARETAERSLVSRETRNPAIATISALSEASSAHALITRYSEIVLDAARGAVDAIVCLGGCDRTVPGMLVGALQFGHLPVIFVPTEPDDVGAGGANGIQALTEVMGLHLPGAAFVTPGTRLRDALARAATGRASEITHLGRHYTPVADVIDEHAIVNGIVGLLATGGLKNHTQHLAAIAEAAGIVVDDGDFGILSSCVPLLARIQPGVGTEENHFHAAGGMGLVIRELLQAGLLHEDVNTVAGRSLTRYTREPVLDGNLLIWHGVPSRSRDETVLRHVSSPFSPTAELRTQYGNPLRAMGGTSAANLA